MSSSLVGPEVDLYDISFLLLTRTVILSKLQIPFPDAKDAQVALRVLEPDPVLRPEDFQCSYTNIGNVLEVHFRSVDDRSLRVGVSNVIDSIKTIIEAIDELA
ncbi:related to Polarized growth chromatin-associated controller 1 [Zygosaccharomyces bailii ISA1307]|nr:related to Polarized growth chromatin-associated controller 1 [Zygosaccharomyces bailii ISA1307]